MGRRPQIAPPDFSRLLALNNAHARELSWLDDAQLANLVRQAFFFRSIGAADAFIIALDETADYRSPNYLWFRARHPRFVYVDRVVVAPEARGRGLARQLYEAVCEEARAAGHRLVCCEVNADPPNPASDAFHASLGFTAVGGAAIAAANKTVRYFERELVER